MFAKGPLPGWSPKTECLKALPNTVCRKKIALNIKGFIIYNEEEPIAVGSSAKLAWENCWSNLINKGTIKRKRI